MNHQTKHVVLHVIDWNGQDRYYEMSTSCLSEFRTRALAEFDDAWDWLVEQTDFGNEPAKSVKFGTVDMRLPVYLLDYNAPAESLATWPTPGR